MGLTTPSHLAPFTTLRRELLADCRVFKVERVFRQSGLTGQTHDFFHIDAATWVNVIAITQDEQLVLVRQERHGLEAFTVEVPAGLVDEGEDPSAAALRELREETGFAGERAELLGWVHPNPALQDNRCYTYLVRDVVAVGAQELDEREEIEVITVPLNQVRQLVRSGEITHALAVAALYLYELGSSPSAASIA
jgi:ADP-ribose pyrophosphatase